MLFYACSQNHIDFNCFIKTVFLVYSRNEGDKILGTCQFSSNNKGADSLISGPVSLGCDN